MLLQNIPDSFIFKQHLEHICSFFYSPSPFWRGSLRTSPFFLHSAPTVHRPERPTLLASLRYPGSRISSLLEEFLNGVESRKVKWDRVSTLDFGFPILWFTKTLHISNFMRPHNHTVTYTQKHFAWEEVGRSLGWVVDSFLCCEECHNRPLCAWRRIKFKCDRMADSLIIMFLIYS